MKRLGLIGYPLEHSFSKKYFEEKFEKEGIADWEYDQFPIRELFILPDLIRSVPDLCGLNVTIPYKENVMLYLDDISDEAVAIGAVNTISIARAEGEDERPILHGYNTDAYGFWESLKPLLKPIHTHALILGSGGGAKAVAYMLKKNGINYIMASRNEKNGITYNKLSKELIANTPLIINCTPLGMFPNIDSAPELDYEGIGPNHICYDLVYNPAETLFIQKAKKQDAVVKNGLEMLHLQAEKAWEIFSKQ